MIQRSEISAFRAQLVVPEQRQLYDYWLEKAAGRKMPARTDINPTHIPRILPAISLVDIEPELGKSRVRLAGTRLREIYDREITGLCIEELDWGEKRDYWLASYRRTVEEGVPTQGIIRGPRSHKEHLVQYWLRLPLCSDTQDKIKILLCYDYFMPASERLEDQRLAYGA
ncbi:MAG: PAS domain-containing protein [Alphaproteobacteria bacterium]|nr:PAS domain-containing protein [Alphaproteobacteria bacterium]